MSLHKPVAIVAYAPIGDADISVPLYPESRYNEIIRSKNPKAQKEKYLVWKLLEKVIEKHFNLEFANLEFTKTDNGQWVCPAFHLSLSHTDGLVCVAVSDDPIGVDAELVRAVRPELDGRILTDMEREFLKHLPAKDQEGYRLTSWVKKESIFKKDGGHALLPNRIEADGYNTSVRRVACGTAEYLIAVCHDRADEIEINFVEEI